MFTKRIKFTFDIKKAIQQHNDNVTFSQINVAKYDIDMFIKQNDVYKRLCSLYNDDIDFKQHYDRSFCAICAVYNAFPFVFDNNTFKSPTD